MFKDRKTQDRIAVVALIIAILLLLFQGPIVDLWQQFMLQFDSRPVLANVEAINHDVRFRKADSLNYFHLKNGMGLRSKDTVATEPNSTTVLSFKSGLKIELEPNTIIVIEDPSIGGGPLELTFLQGGMKVLSQGSGVVMKGLDIPKDQVKLDLGSLDKAPTPPPEIKGQAVEEKKVKEKFKKKTTGQETLPDSYIASVIRQQRPFLNRCYAQHLRLNPNARGRIDTSLTIDPDGTVSTARVIGSTIADPTLQQCVVTTLQRCRFRTFGGDPIIINYPINFE